MDTSNAYTGNITLNAYGNVNINGTAIYINNPLNTVGILSSVNTSTFTAPPINFVNTHTAPNTTLSVLGPNMGALSYNGIEVGQSDTTGNTGSFNFQWAGNNNASNKIFIEFFGGGGTNLTLYNSTSTGALFNSNLSAIQYTSTVAIGTAPLVVTSTTLVALLYVARSALADTCTTIPALTGDVTSVANVTTYNNAVPIAKGGTGVVGGLASPGTIGGTAAGIVNATTVAATSTVTGTQLISNIAIGTAPLVVTSTTVVPNLNVSQLLGGTWAIPGTIGSTTANTGAFTTLNTSNTTSTYTSASVTFTNTNVAPDSCVAVLGPNMTSGNEIDLFIGQSLGTGNCGTLGFVYSGNNNAASYTYVGPWGGATKMKLYSNTAKTEVNSSFSATSYLSTATLGSALTSVLKAPSITYYSTGGSSGNYTVPSPTPLYIRVEMVGAGGGGGGSGAGAGNGVTGGNTTFNDGTNTWTCNGGGGGSGASVSSGAGGTCTVWGGQISNIYGGVGGGADGGGAGAGGASAVAYGGTSCYGFTAHNGSFGGGGSGAGGAGVVAGSGGGGGGFASFQITAAAGTTLAYAVGQSLGAGSPGTSGYAGGSGGDGRIIVIAYWQ